MMINVLVDLKATFLGQVGHPDAADAVGRHMMDRLRRILDGDLRHGQTDQECHEASDARINQRQHSIGDYL